MIYLLLTSVFILTLFLIGSIPNSSIIGNVKTSVETFEKEGLFPVSFGNQYSSLSFLSRDQYTDCLMFNLVVADNQKGTINNVITNPCYKGTYKVEEMPSNVLKLLNHEISPDTNYDWYWHGYIVFLKPLLIFLDYDGIRWFNSFLMLLSFSALLYLVKKRIGIIESLITLAVALICHGETIPYTLQYTSVFFVAVFASILLLWKPDKWNEKNIILFFFCVGAVTVYLDFLTFPVVSLGIPMLYWLLYRNDSPIQKIKYVVLLSLAWGGGYALLWATKWCLCALTYDPLVISNAMLHADKWSSSSVEHSRLFLTLGVIKKYLALIWSMNWLSVLITGCVCLFIMQKNGRWFYNNCWMLLIAIIPFVWSMVLVNHNYAHFGFTWRLIIITMLSFSFFVYRVIKTR